jgi:capsule polysaccharide export protein KpsE/RkpR
MPVAVTDIKHGYIDDQGNNQVLVIPAGTELTSEHADIIGEEAGLLLVEAGAVIQSLSNEDQQRLADLEAEVESLRAQLLTAQGAIGSTAPNDVMDTGAPTDNADENNQTSSDTTTSDTTAGPTPQTPEPGAEPGATPTP